ncbi:MAG: prepilin-type N-terminal cleavage/methylation domain-containing protein [Planctomycetota bacterium]|jgi:prepilin-type N-terminal cleavage/methylation domain-containing protein/prepilin-type processing-associated H-X9-DG protein
MKKGKAFTLIELLVVIAMIALLLAILMPALRAAKDQAKKTVCTGHVQGLVLAVRMYVDDYDGKTHDSPNNGLWDNAHENPLVPKDYGPNDSMAYWGIAYFPYAKNKKIFHCPGMKRVDDWPEWGPPWGRPSQQYFKHCSYGLNNYITDKKIDLEFKRHSEVIAFQDHIEQRLDSINSDMFCIGPSVNINLTQWRNGGTLGDFPEAVQECFRHRGASITVWLDGHVTEIEETTGEDVPTRWYTGE